MTTPVETIAPSASILAAFERMERGRFHHLVVMEKARIVGVLSAHDVGPEPVDDGRTAGELMTQHPFVVERDATLRQIANKLRGNVIGCLPVVEEGKVIGIVTTSDLLDALGRGATRPVERGERWTLKNRGPRHRPAPQGGVR